VPVIGCGCAVCQSRDPKDKRGRCAAWVHGPGQRPSLLIDTGPEFRAQALREGILRADAALYTHAHADHISGLDDLRVFGERQACKIPCYGNRQTLALIRERFGYVFRPTQKGGGKPQITLCPVAAPWVVAGLKVRPVPLWHGKLKTLGWRIGDMAYLTDTHRIPEASFGLLKGLRLLVLDALRPSPHPTHFSLPQAVAAARRIGAQRTLFTHITHQLPHAATCRSLPKGMALGFDGQSVEFNG
jgi:phosphoribosyl 1,2-cyclic phosphate phosphodiesterase